MASSIESQSLTKFKCNFCNNIPSELQVNRCSNGHIVCLQCRIQRVFCKCSSDTFVKIPNPIVKIVGSTKKECKFKNAGCNWVISNDGEDHHAECKFRPYNCIGAALGIWTCDWIGTQQEFAAHMKEHHVENGNFFKHFTNSFVDFEPDKECVKFNLINAFNKYFAFLYLSHLDDENIVFVIYLLGRKIDAHKYVIDFELKANNSLRKVKFIEECFTDSDDILKVIKDHRCFVVPKTLMESYSSDGKLEFRFVIKRRDVMEVEIVNQHQLMNNLLHY
ncbi:E3 ubiquitin-protein ligase siah-1-like [Contarinia nasturtii]|uniref:E3 ubiquitin-protein ligase siah-1-like n=1 Tax=Contarinia nasturtii TaxID=265458 RepID=UPI0012D46D00|nr:E3 ubiquitin-protein ligase siah-1-like [Contarinia nasturtii]